MQLTDQERIYVVDSDFSRNFRILKIHTPIRRLALCKTFTANCLPGSSSLTICLCATPTIHPHAPASEKHVSNEMINHVWGDDFFSGMNA